jgi:hypothetical protein
VTDPRKPAFTVIGSFRAFKASALSCKSFKTTSPVSPRSSIYHIKHVSCFPTKASKQKIKLQNDRLQLKTSSLPCNSNPFLCVKSQTLPDTYFQSFNWEATNIFSKIKTEKMQNLSTNETIANIHVSEQIFMTLLTQFRSYYQGQITSTPTSLNPVQEFSINSPQLRYWQKLCEDNFGTGA